MKPVLVAENIFKRYSMKQDAHRAYAVKDLLGEIFLRPKVKDPSALREDEFWAVNDISLTLYPGDALALIGKNGSGKSTLLKILNGLIKPESGSLFVEGSMQALINLGAGFDRRLSGLENVLHSAALMGISKRDANKILDDVLEFADIGEFIHSPVSTYSSGMYARLGFSVATHLRPDIILIDEILAVGDDAFKNKCYAKMRELKSAGVTMVLVSHSHAVVSQFCDKALWLHEGKEKALGECKETLKKYLSFMEAGGNKGIRNIAKSSTWSSKDNKVALFGAIYDDLDRVRDVKFKVISDNGSGTVSVNSSLVIEYEFFLVDSIIDLNVSINIYRNDGLLLTTISTLNHDLFDRGVQGRVHCRVLIRDLNLNPGEYTVVLPVHAGHSYLYRDVVGGFSVVGGEALTWGLVNFDYEYRCVKAET